MLVKANWKIGFISSWLQFFLALFLITFLSLTPNPGAAFEHTSDKLLHVIGWSGLALSLGVPFVLVFCLSFVLHQKSPTINLGKYPLAAIGLFLYSIGIEIVQPITGRQFDWLDILANGIGVIVGGVLVYSVSYILLRWLSSKDLSGS